jgi:hypothetical protein
VDIYEYVLCVHESRSGILDRVLVRIRFLYRGAKPGNADGQADTANDPQTINDSREQEEKRSQSDRSQKAITKENLSLIAGDCEVTLG